MTTVDSTSDERTVNRASCTGGEMSDLIRVLRGQRIDGRSTDEIMCLAADELDRLNAQALELCAEISGLRREREDFHMDYRMKCDEETKRLHVDNERLRGLLREAADDIEHWGGYASEYFKDKWHLDDDIKKYREAAGAAVQPSALPERCSVCGGAHDVGNPCRATSPTKAGQPERCCLDYPRCDCNSPPEPAQEPKGCNHFPGQVNCEWCTEVPHE